MVRINRGFVPNVFKRVANFLTIDSNKLTLVRRVTVGSALKVRRFVVSKGYRDLPGSRIHRRGRLAMSVQEIWNKPWRRPKPTIGEFGPLVDPAGTTRPRFGHCVRYLTDWDPGFKKTDGAHSSSGTKKARPWLMRETPNTGPRHGHVLTASRRVHIGHAMLTHPWSLGACL